MAITSQEEFSQMCVNNQVEVTIQARPNPGNPYVATRMLKIRSFSDNVIKVYQQGSKEQIHMIPAHGSVEIMLMSSSDPLPRIEKAE